MRFRLRTLLIVLAVGPALIAFAYWEPVQAILLLLISAKFAAEWWSSNQTVSPLP